MADKALQPLIPSHTLLRRYQLALDVAIILLARRRIAKLHADGETVARWAWSDSSPIAGFDWLWNRLIEIPESKVVQTSDAIVDLMAGVHEYCAASDGSDEALASVLPICDEWRPLLKIISANIFELILTPTALGSGHRGLAHKCGGLAFPMKLHNPTEVHINDAARTIFGHTADTGTESSMADFVVEPDVASLLPNWLNKQKMEAEHDMAFDGDILEEVGQQIEDDAPLLVDSEDGLDIVERVGPHGEAMHPQHFVDEADGADAADGDPQPQHFMENGLPWLGFQHTVNHVTCEVHTALSRWKWALSYLKNFEALLRMRERRERFIATAKVDRLGRHLSQHDRAKLQRWNATLYEERWREVVAFMSALISNIHIFANHWDEVAYVSKTDDPSRQQSAQGKRQDEQERAAGLVQFDPALVTKALRSGLFFPYISMLVAVEELLPKLAQRLERCPCHQPFASRMSAYNFNRLMEAHYGQGVTTCPAAGMTVPEFVSDDLLELEAKLWEEFEDLLLSTKPLACSDLQTSEEQMCLVCDFHAAKAHISGLFKTRTDYCRRLPWCLFGLAHYREDRARDVGRRALEM